MALHAPSDDLHHQAELDRRTRENACLIMAALHGGSRIYTAHMTENLGEILGNSQALAALIRETAQGKNAFLMLLQQLALGQGERQARSQLAAVGAV